MFDVVAKLWNVRKRQLEPKDVQSLYSRMAGPVRTPFSSSHTWHVLLQWKPWAVNQFLCMYNPLVTLEGGTVTLDAVKVHIRDNAELLHSLPNKVRQTLVLHLQVAASDISEGYPSKPEIATFCSREVHTRFTCDVCEQYPIFGPRIRCNICADYDLCNECHSSRQSLLAKLGMFDVLAKLWNVWRVGKALKSLTC